MQWRIIMRTVLLFLVGAACALAGDFPAIQDAIRFSPSAEAAAFDGEGNLFLAGVTWGFSGAPNRTVIGRAAQLHVYVIKIGPSRRNIEFVTEIGSSANETFGGFAVDASGNAYIAGSSAGSDFPITPGAFVSDSLLSVFEIAIREAWQQLSGEAGQNREAGIFDVSGSEREDSDSCTGCEHGGSLVRRGVDRWAHVPHIRAVLYTIGAGRYRPESKRGGFYRSIETGWVRLGLVDVTRGNIRSRLDRFLGYCPRWPSLCGWQRLFY